MNEKTETIDETITPIYANEVSFTEDTSNRVTADTVSDSTLIKTVTDNLTSQSTEASENASILPVISNGTDMVVTVHTTIESEYTKETFTFDKSSYIANTFDHSSPSAPDYSIKENIPTVSLKENTHFSETSLEELESTRVPSSLPSTQTEETVSRVSNELDSINSDVYVSSDRFETQAFERQSTLESGLPSGSIVTEKMKNFTVAQSVTMISLSQSFVTSPPYSEKETIGNAVQTVEVPLQSTIQNSSTKSTKESDNKSEATTAKLSTFSWSSSSMVSSESVTTSRLFTKTQPSPATTNQGVIIENDATTHRTNGNPPRESSTDSSTISNAGHITVPTISQSTQTSQNETWQSNVNISTNATNKPTSLSTLSPATCSSRFFLDTIGTPFFFYIKTKYK